MEAWHKVRYYWVTDVRKVLLIRCSLRVSHHQSVARPDPAAQERERLLSTLQEEASIAKDKVKQLSQVSTFLLCSANYMMQLLIVMLHIERTLPFVYTKWFTPCCLCASGASGWEAKDKPGGGNDERAAYSHGEGAGQHAEQSTEQLPGTPDHADKSRGFFMFPHVFLFLLPWRLCQVEKTGI